MTRRSGSARKPRSQASDSGRPRLPSPLTDNDKRLFELEQTLELLRTQVQTNSRQLIALQAQLDHVAAKQRT